MKPPESSIPFRRYRSIIIVMIAGIVLSSFSFSLTRHNERRILEEKFRADAQDRFFAIKREIESDLEALHGLHALYLSSDEVTNEEFREYAQVALSRHPSIQAFEWIPKILHSERKKFEASARMDGMHDFTITERETQGKMVTAAERGEYLPAYFVEPYEGNELARGYDLASNPVRLKALDKARDTGSIAATAGITLVQGKGNQLGFLAAIPLYEKNVSFDTVADRRKTLQGFVLAVFRIGEIVEKAFSYLQAKGLDIHLFDESDDRRARFLYTHWSWMREQGQTLKKHAITEWSTSYTLGVADRQWLIVAEPIPAYLSQIGYRHAASVAGGILVITLLIAFFLKSTLTRAMQSEQLVQDLAREAADRKKAESIIQNERDRTQNYLDIAGVMFVVINADQRIGLINRRGCDILGYSEREIIGKNWFDNFLPERDKDRIKAVFAKLMAGEVQPLEYYENPVVTKSGKERIIAWHNTVLTDNRGNRVGTLSSGEDITERTLADEALRLSEEKFSMAFRSSPTFISISALSDGRFIEINDAFLHASGFSREEIIGRSSKAIGLWDNPDDYDRMIDQLRNNGIIQNLETGFRIKTGEVLPVLFSAEMIDMDREPCILSVAQDITERKKLESQLLHSQKMEAVGELAGGVAHEFNNILTAIISYSFLLHKRVREEDSRSIDYISKILSLADRAQDITRGLLTFSRKQYVEFLPLDLNDILQETGRLMTKLIRDDIEMKITLSTEGLTITGDRNQIEQIIMNLVTNAQDAMPDGGSLFIGSELVSMDDAFIQAHGFGESGTYAALSVMDTGTGMNQEIRQRIFEPFFTTKQVGKGTGLGLSIVYGIVKEHNGYINVSSEPNKGSTFTVYFPEITASIAEKKKKELLHLKGTKEILLVAEDEPTVRESIRTMLESFDYAVIEAVDGSDAIEKFIEHKDEIQLIILDVIMPKMDGKETYEAMKQVKPDLKAIFTSGYSADVLHKRKILERELTFVSKPIVPNQLLMKIREVLEG